MIDRAFSDFLGVIKLHFKGVVDVSLQRKVAGCSELSPAEFSEVPKCDWSMSIFSRTCCPGEFYGDFEKFVEKMDDLRVAIRLGHEDRTSAVSSSC